MAVIWMRIATTAGTEWAIEPSANRLCLGTRFIALVFPGREIQKILFDFNRFLAIANWMAEMFDGEAILIHNKKHLQPQRSLSYWHSCPAVTT